MPLFKSSAIQKHTPRVIALTDIYRRSLRRNQLSPSDRRNLSQALAAAGYNQTEAAKLLTAKIPVRQAKEIAAKLSRAGLTGWSQYPDKLVARYVRGEAIKNKNLAARRRELMLESRRDNLGVPKPVAKSTGGKIKLGF